ncbi:MAG: hypothetical protein HY513_05620 [Candidatus Aenigmarchaeota archaeon]|nr:hypothetical protein [Candidatus Aenigmarchaeota archaeon]
MTDIVDQAPVFFIALMVFLIIVVALLVLSQFRIGAVANPQPITVTTLPEDQAAKVIINCLSKQQLGQITRYDFKINTEDLGLFSQDKHQNLLPIFIFKSSAIPAKKIGEDTIDPAKGISIPDPLKKDPLESIYTFESYEAVSIDTFSPLETVLIAFLATGESSSVTAIECRNEAVRSFEKYKKSPAEYKLLHNLKDFQAKCQPLLKGIVSVKAANNCISDVSARISIVDASVISRPSGENTNIQFTVTAITPIIEDKHVKIYVFCNSDESKNKYMPQGDNYVEQKALTANKFSVDMICGGSDIEVQLIKNCIDKDATPGCDSAPNPDDIIATEVRLPPVA